MKLHTCPKVYLIANTIFHLNEVLSCLKEVYGNNTDWVRTSVMDSELLCEFAGRVCYESFGNKQGRKDTFEYLLNILRQGHGSILEHPNATFFITGASRGMMAQLTRHRAGCAFSIESTHFIKYDISKINMCICGLNNIYENKDTMDLITDPLYESIRNYNKLIDKLSNSTLPKKFIQGVTRSLLPTALEAKIVFTCNFRALRHIIELRGNKDNVPEIRLVAKQLLEHAKVIAPILFDDFEVTTSLADGYPMISCTHHKV